MHWFLRSVLIAVSATAVLGALMPARAQLVLVQDGRPTTDDRLGAQSGKKPDRGSPEDFVLKRRGLLKKQAPSSKEPGAITTIPPEASSDLVQTMTGDRKK